MNLCQVTIYLRDVVPTSQIHFHPSSSSHRQARLLTLGRHIHSCLDRLSHTSAKLQHKMHEAAQPNAICDVRQIYAQGCTPNATSLFTHYLFVYALADLAASGITRAPHHQTHPDEPPPQHLFPIDAGQCMPRRLVTSTRLQPGSPQVRCLQIQVDKHLSHPSVKASLTRINQVLGMSPA